MDSLRVTIALSLTQIVLTSFILGFIVGRGF